MTSGVAGSWEMWLRGRVLAKQCDLGRAFLASLLSWKSNSKSTVSLMLTTTQISLPNHIWLDVRIIPRISVPQTIWSQTIVFWGGRKVINICWLHFKFHSGKVGRRTSWWSDINLSFDQEEERHRQPPYSCSWMPQSASLKITTRPPPHPNTIKSSAAQYCTFLKTHLCTSLLQLLHCNTDISLIYISVHCTELVHNSVSLLCLFEPEAMVRY